jgi:hypothetical protein
VCSRVGTGDGAWAAGVARSGLPITSPCSLNLLHYVNNFIVTIITDSTASEVWRFQMQHKQSFKRHFHEISSEKFYSQESLHAACS